MNMDPRVSQGMESRNAGARCARFRWSVALAVAVIVVAGARAQEAQKPAEASQPPVPAPANFNGCSNLFVTISSAVPLSVGYVNCSSGVYGGTQPSSSIAAYQPATMMFAQSVGKGPNCQFNLMIPGTNTVYTSLVVQQNFCYAMAGNITYSVASGPAAFSGVVVGSYIVNLPGRLYVTVAASNTNAQ